MWRAAGLNVQLHMLENWSQVTEPGATRGIRDWSVTHVYNDPLASLVRAMGPRGELQRAGEGVEFRVAPFAGELEASTDRDRRRAVFRRMLEITEREDPAYMVLHQAATFTAKRRNIRWKAGRGWPMDFRAANLGFGA
jgi:peptide/nickel transport system substrate-binding protein